MVNALVFLQLHSFRNRALLRLKRLKQPKYMLGAIVGLIWFWFYIIRPAYGAGKWNGAPAFGGSVDWELIGAFILLLILSLNWIFQRDRAALTFTEAELAFLFPAPISRLNLIHYKLLRSQAGILFSVFIFTILGRKMAGSSLAHAVGTWLLLSTLSLHSLGASFTRTRLMDRGVTTLQRRMSVLAILALVLGGAVWWTYRTYPASLSFEDPSAIWESVQAMADSGPLYYLLWPLRLLVRPYLASTTLDLFNSVWPAFALLILHYVWVVRSQVAFEEASVDASRTLADKIAAARSGNWHSGSELRKGVRDPFRLSPIGPGWVALVWKNLIAARKVINPRLLIFLGAMLIPMVFILGSTRRSGGITIMILSLIGMLYMWSLMLGPQFLRQDFRSDLPMADVLKQLPLPSWQLALGQVLTPVCLISLIQWLLLLVALPLVFQVAGPTKLPPAIILACALSLAFVMPMLNSLAIQIPNMAVLLFPAWFHLGKENPSGIEAMGQRLVVLTGQVLAFAVTLLPAAIVGGIAFFLARWAGGMALGILLAGFTAALVLAAEAALGVFLLGKLFERFDFSLESQ